MKISFEYFHKPVLLKEVLHYLNIERKKGIWVDATLGLGGHSKAILERIDKDSKLIGIDCDEESLNIAIKNLSGYKNFVPLKGNFKEIDLMLKKIGINKIDGILYDLGVSSLHFEKADRGFSFMKNATLDMRLDRTSNLTGYDIVNKYSYSQLNYIIKEYGEERQAKKIAAEIIKSRPINTTLELVEVIKRVKKNKERINPATKVFQAIRIAVNNELKNLKQSLERVVKLLNPGARIVVISFHSLEDRIVKKFFEKEAIDCICENKKMPCTCGHIRTLKILTKKPILPDDTEIKENIRARSAKLRSAERL